MIEQLLDMQRKEPGTWPADIAAALDDDIVSPLAQHRRLRPLLFFLLSNLSERLSAEQAAKIVSLETKYFSKYFLRETGFNFAWWNREVRIQLATRLLEQRGRNITSIALAVGYVDVTTFERAFKKCWGVCPQAYRVLRSSPRAAPKRESADLRTHTIGLNGSVTKNAENMTTNADCFHDHAADAKPICSDGWRAPMKTTRRGFTLIELLVVIAILGFIASLVGPSVIKQFGGAKVDTARLQISDLSAALDLYYLDLGRYPTTAEGLAALIAAPDDVRDWDGPYLKKSAVPNDPWGNTYGYKAPGDNGPYDLFSYGADRQLGGERDNADVVSWE
jgi:general secretion pathway protein G